MAFTYEVSQLAEVPLFQVRFRLGDTEEETATFQDEEILYSLEVNSNDVLRTCIDCISALLPRLAQKSSFKVGPYSESEGKSAYDYWMKLLNMLKSKVGGFSPPMMKPPTTPPIFHYNMMGVDDDGSPKNPSGCC